MTHTPLRLVLVCACLLATVQAAAEAPSHHVRTIRATGDYNFPPYEFEDELGRPAGFNVDLLGAVANAMHLRASVQLKEWATARRDLREGRADVLMGMFRSDERAQEVEFSIPHTLVTHCLFVRRDSQVKELADLTGKTVLVQEGDLMDELASRSQLRANVRRFATPVEALRALADGQGDAALLSRVQGLYLSQANRLEGIREVDVGLEPREYCFAVRKGDTALLALLNEGLMILRSNGGYDRLRRKWFGPKSVSFWQRAEARYVVYLLAVVIALLAFASVRSYLTGRALQRKQKALAEAEERWHSALDSSELGVFDWDLLSNRVSYSDFYWRLLGYKEECAGGPIEKWEARVHPDDLPVVREALQRHLRRDTPRYVQEYRMRCADGSYRWFLARGKALVRDAEGRPVRHFGTIADISERKDMELELAAARDLLELRVRERTAQLAERVAEAEQVNRAMMNVLQDLQSTNQKLERVSGALEETNRELDAFAYSVSHDLRAPLRAIDGFARILAEDYGSVLDAEGRRLLGVVQNNAQHMAQLIGDLLAFSRLGRRPMTQSLVPMQVVVDEVVQALRERDGARVEFDLGSLPCVPGDRAMLRQAFANLLENAVKYSSQKANPRVVVRGIREGASVHYSVQDNGIGFEQKYATKIFGVFERLHSSDQFSGTGVGLSLVQRIVQRHGGTVWAEAVPGEGATFHLRLPGAELAAEPWTKRTTMEPDGEDV